MPTAPLRTCRRTARNAAFALVLAVTVVACVAKPARAQEGSAIERGEYIFHAAACASCHTAEDGPPLAGGVALDTPFGRFHAPNITPHPQAGIGGWSLEDFSRALKQGRAPGGAPYYPAFPYTAYTGMQPDDVADLWAYMQSVEPSANRPPPHELDFPYSIRWGLYAWQALFFESGDFQAEPAKHVQWNRGAYLVRHLGHCGECHTPRNIFGALERDRHLAGNPQGPEGDPVPNITPHDADGIGDWSVSDITFYLEIGFEPSGDVAGGAMGQVIDDSTGKLTGDDREAIARYLKSLPPRPDARP